MLITIALAIWLAYLTYRSFIVANFTQEQIDALVVRATGWDTALVTIKTEVAALKTANPTVDTSKLEAVFTQLDTDATPAA